MSPAWRPHVARSHSPDVGVRFASNSVGPNETAMMFNVFAPIWLLFRDGFKGESGRNDRRIHSVGRSTVVGTTVVAIDQIDDDLDHWKYRTDRSRSRSSRSYRLIDHLDNVGQIDHLDNIVQIDHDLDHLDIVQIDHDLDHLDIVQIDHDLDHLDNIVQIDHDLDHLDIVRIDHDLDHLDIVRIGHDLDHLDNIVQIDHDLDHLDTV